MFFNPSKIIITPEMLSLIAEIEEFKGAWNLWGQMAPERLHELKKVATIESIGSSTRIEGSKLSDREVERLLMNIHAYVFESRDEQEVAGYAYVCEALFQNYHFIPFSENIIKQLHGDLLKFSSRDERHRGHYKTLPNNVEAFDEKGKSLGILLQTSSPFETPLQMQELVYWTAATLEDKSLHPLLVAAVFVVVFLSIHPFQDGNGRLSRILTTLLLLKSGYHYVPYSSLESIIERNRESYYLALRRTQTTLRLETPDWEAWLLFFLKALKKQKSHLEQKISAEKSLLFDLPELSAEMMRLVQTHGKLGVTEFEKLTQANRNTLKKHLASLVKKGLLQPLGKGRATLYQRSGIL